MAGKNIDRLLSELYSEIHQTNDVEYLMYIFQIFKKGKYEFLNHYYAHVISQLIVDCSISLEQGDFFLANAYGEIRSYKFKSGVGYFDSIADIRERQKDGFFVKGIPFLKSGQLPSRTNVDQWVSESEIIKIVKGFRCVNNKDEKAVYNLLRLTEEDLSILKEGNRPIIIDVSK